MASNQDVWQIFEPEPPPTSGNTDDMVRYLFTEYSRLASFVQIVASGQLEITNVMPPKPRGGMIRIADGTNWNPGGGRGVYWYDDTGPGWTKL